VEEGEAPPFWDCLLLPRLTNGKKKKNGIKSTIPECDGNNLGIMTSIESMTTR